MDRLASSFSAAVSTVSSTGPTAFRGLPAAVTMVNPGVLAGSIGSAPQDRPQYRGTNGGANSYGRRQEYWAVVFPERHGPPVICLEGTGQASASRRQCTSQPPP